MIPQPTKATLDPVDKVSNLYFGTDAHPMNGRYAMRGAVCWPIVTLSGMDRVSQGHLIIAGQHLDSGILWVFSDAEFVTVDHVVGEAGRIEIEGAVTLFNRAWATFFAKVFYFAHPEALHKPYHLQVLRSKLIDPKPTFIDLEADDTVVAQHALWRWMRSGALRIDKDSALAREIGLFQQQQADVKELRPAVHAMCALTHGLDRFGFRAKRRVEK